MMRLLQKLLPLALCEFLRGPCASSCSRIRQKRKLHESKDESTQNPQSSWLSIRERPKKMQTPPFFQFRKKDLMWDLTGQSWEPLRNEKTSGFQRARKMLQYSKL